MTSSHFIHKFWENPPFLTRHQLKFSRCLLHFQNVLQINFKNAVFLLESFFMKNFEYQFTVDNENMQMRIFVLKILRHNLKFPHTHKKNCCTVFINCLLKEREIRIQLINGFDAAFSRFGLSMLMQATNRIESCHHEHWLVRSTIVHSQMIN